MTYWITEAPANAEPQDGENGRSILPNGVIIMWGTATNGGDKCLFHTPFPNNCFAVNYTGSSGQRVNPKLATKDRFGFTLHHRETSRGWRGGMARRNNDTVWEHIRYVAVGN